MIVQHMSSHHHHHLHQRKGQTNSISPANGSPWMLYDRWWLLRWCEGKVVSIIHRPHRRCHRQIGNRPLSGECCVKYEMTKLWGTASFQPHRFRFRFHCGMEALKVKSVLCGMTGSLECSTWDDNSGWGDWDKMYCDGMWSFRTCWCSF